MLCESDLRAPREDDSGGPLWAGESEDESEEDEDALRPAARDALDDAYMRAGLEGAQQLMAHDLTAEALNKGRPVGATCSFANTATPQRPSQLSC